MKIRLTLAATASLALAACGSADDASTEAEPDTVEIPANDALEGVTAEPVADPEAAIEQPVTGDTAAATAAEAQRIEEAGDNAAETAGAALDALNDTDAAEAEAETETE